MFKFSSVLDIAVCQCIPCECSWRCTFRNWSACGAYK